MSETSEAKIVVWLQTELVRSTSNEALASTGVTTNLTESGILDSFDFLKFISDLEITLGTELDLSDEDPSNFLTLGGLAHIIASKGLKET